MDLILFSASLKLCKRYIPREIILQIIQTSKVVDHVLMYKELFFRPSTSPWTKNRIKDEYLNIEVQLHIPVNK